MAIQYIIPIYKPPPPSITTDPTGLVAWRSRKDRYPGGQAFFDEWERLSNLVSDNLSQEDEYALKKALTQYKMIDDRIKWEEKEEYAAERIDYYSSEKYTSFRALMVKYLEQGTWAPKLLKEIEVYIETEDKEKEKWLKSEKWMRWSSEV